MTDTRERTATNSRATSLRFMAEYAAFRALVAAFHVLGLDRASAVNGKLWEWVAPLTVRHKRALQHLALAFPEKTEDEREQIARAVWNNLGRTAAEACFLEAFETPGPRVNLVTPEIAARIKAEHGGVAVFTPMHSGNWEVLSPASVAYGFPAAGMYQRVKNPYAENYLRSLRAKYAAGDVIPKNQSAVRRLITSLKSGISVVILSDQRHRGAYATFFGHPAPSTPLPAYLARSLDVPLIACRVIRTHGAHFDIEFREVPVGYSDDREHDIAQATQALQSTFEGWIRENPGQWMWAHRRWARKGPPRTLEEIAASRRAK